MPKKKTPAHRRRGPPGRRRPRGLPAPAVPDPQLRPAPGRPGLQRHPHHRGHAPGRQGRLLRQSPRPDADHGRLAGRRRPLRGLHHPDAPDPALAHDHHDRDAAALPRRPRQRRLRRARRAHDHGRDRSRPGATRRRPSSPPTSSIPSGGSNQGFDTYFDKFDLSRFERISLGEVQRPANEVIDEALGWIDAKKDGKFFAWIHLYDPHTPYDPPEPFKSEYRQNPYLGEIAFTDSQLARLCRATSTATALRDRLFIVLAGRPRREPGRAPGEHPRLLRLPGGPPRAPDRRHAVPAAPGGRRAGRPSAWSTSCPRSAKWPASRCRPRSRDGASSRPSSRRAPRRTGWPTRRPSIPVTITAGPTSGASRTRRYKLILAPVPELYDLEPDPDEEKNLVYLEKKVYEDLSARAETLMDEAGAGTPTRSDLGKVDEETREKLAALGYVGSFTDPSRLQGQKLANPKDKIGVFNELSRAREIGLGREHRRGRQDDPRPSSPSDPTISDAYFALGNVLYKARRFEEAIDAFSKSLELQARRLLRRHQRRQLLPGHGPLRRRRDVRPRLPGPGLQGFPAPLPAGQHQGPPRPARRRPSPISRSAWRRTRGRPRPTTPWRRSTSTATRSGDLARAEEHLGAAVAINPTLMSLRYNLAQLREKQGRLAEAADLYLQEIRDSPKSYKALYNLSRRLPADGAGRRGIRRR